MTIARRTGHVLHWVYLAKNILDLDGNYLAVNWLANQSIDWTLAVVLLHVVTMPAALYFPIKMPVKIAEEQRLKASLKGKELYWLMRLALVGWRIATIYAMARFHPMPVLLCSFLIIFDMTVIFNYTKLIQGDLLFKKCLTAGTDDGDTEEDWRESVTSLFGTFLDRVHFVAQRTSAC